MIIQKIIEHRNSLFWSINNDQLIAGGYINGLSYGNLVFEQTSNSIVLRISKNTNSVSDINMNRIEISKGSEQFDLIKKFIEDTKMNISSEDYQLHQSLNRNDLILNVSKLIEQI